MERLDDPRLARRFVTSRLLYRRLRRYLWAPPLVLAALALLLRVEFVVDGLGHVFRSPRQQSALQHAYDASWFSRFLVTVAHRDRPARGLGRRGGRHLARASGARSAARGSPHRGRRAAPRAQGARSTAHSLLTIGGEDVLDATRSAIGRGAAGMIVGGALVPELTHLDAGFFASPGATSEIVHEHRGRFGLPPTFLHHRQEAMVELETGADLHIRLMHAEVDLPHGHPGRAAAHAATPSSREGPRRPTSIPSWWPAGPAAPPGRPAPEVAADRIRVRRIRRMAAIALFVAGLIDLLSAVTAPVRHHLHLISQYLPD